MPDLTEMETHWLVTLENRGLMPVEELAPVLATRADELDAEAMKLAERVRHLEQSIEILQSWVQNIAQQSANGLSHEEAYRELAERVNLFLGDVLPDPDLLPL